MQLRHKFSDLKHPGGQNHCYTLSEMRFAVCIHAIFHAVCQNPRKSRFLARKCEFSIKFCFSAARVWK
jgi:hypothetical protein